jgi:hypothetical protein
LAVCFSGKKSEKNKISDEKTLFLRCSMPLRYDRLRGWNFNVAFFQRKFIWLALHKEVSQEKKDVNWETKNMRSISRKWKRFPHVTQQM